MERISAFMDGESAHTETQQAVQRLKQDDESNETWAAPEVAVLSGRVEPASASGPVSTVTTRSASIWGSGLQQTSAV